MNNPYTPKTREEFEAYCRAMDEANEAVVKSATGRDQTTQARHREQLPESVLHDTARYIAAEWEMELPGCTANDTPEKVRAAILDFMRCHGIQTIEDYENSLIKDQQTQ